MNIEKEMQDVIDFYAESSGHVPEQIDMKKAILIHKVFKAYKEQKSQMDNALKNLKAGVHENNYGIYNSGWKDVGAAIFILEDALGLEHEQI